LKTPSDIYNNASGTPIMESKVVYAFSVLKNRKAPEGSNIHVEILRLVNSGKLCPRKFVNKFVYLGLILSNQDVYKKEIRNKIQMSKAALNAAQ
jgi:hypothetical protein